jgi:flagellar biosynthesis/type III secretory pathway protein FliH
MLPVDGTQVDAWTPDSIAVLAAFPESPAQLQAAIEDGIEAAVAPLREHARVTEAALIASLEERKEELIRDAFDRGYEEGRIAGELAEAARLRMAVRAAEEALDALRVGEIRWTGTIEENVCALAVTVARQIIGRELVADIEPIAELIRAALVEFPIDQPIRIRINPGDLNTLSSSGIIEGDPLRGITQSREARWLPDASIAPGGCMVEGRERIIDGRVDTALERVYRRLTYTNA